MHALRLRKAPEPLSKLGMLTPEQCRAARAMLGWSREELAKRAQVSTNTVVGFELLGADSKVSTLQKLRRAFIAAGIDLIEDGSSSPDGGPGVRWRKGRKP
jgi:ribosome-binding protein aMBF1 (putative translation factor)